MYALSIWKCQWRVSYSHPEDLITDSLRSAVSHGNWLLAVGIVRNIPSQFRLFTELITPCMIVRNSDAGAM